MDKLGIIFSDIDRWNKTDLALARSTASIPFGGRYRLVDFTLSNMVNAGINNIFILPQTNYFSLMRHVSSGKDWNLSRKKGGIILFPPYALEENSGLYKGRLEALKRILDFISATKAKYVIMADSDFIYNMDFNKAIQFHKEKNADITAICTSVCLNKSTSAHEIILRFDSDKCLDDMLVYPVAEGVHNISMGAWIFSRDYLISTVNDAIAHNHNEFKQAILPSGLKKQNIFCYEYEGYFAHIDSMLSYYKNNMRLLQKENILDLFYSENGPIYTKTKDSAPTNYAACSNVKNSIIASGCNIKGTVENSIIFRGVEVEENAVIRNSIIMQHTKIEKNAQLDSVVTDMNVQIREGRTLFGTPGCPFYIRKDTIV